MVIATIVVVPVLALAGTKSPFYFHFPEVCKKLTWGRQSFSKTDLSTHTPFPNSEPRRDSMWVAPSWS